MSLKIQQDCLNAAVAVDKWKKAIDWTTLKQDNNWMKYVNFVAVKITHFLH